MAADMDILSKTNRSGSGIELKSMVDSLVTAETADKRATAEARKEDAGLSLSAMGSLATEVMRFKTGIAAARDQNDRQTNSGSRSLEIEVTNATLAHDFNASVTVDRLAKAQTIHFPLAAGVNVNDAVAEGTLSLLRAGEADAFAEVAIGAFDATLAGLRDALDEVAGLSAQLLDTGSGLALLLKPETGTSNALDQSSIDAIAALLEGRIPPDVSPVVIGATDAQFTVDGVTVVRGGNIIDDLFPGHRLTLTSTEDTAFDVVSERKVSDISERLQGLLSDINALKRYLSNATQRGLNGAEPGPLAGDYTAQSIERRLAGITTEAIMGFGGEPVFLAELGIRTERDGSLRLDRETLEQVLSHRSELADALFQTGYSSDTPGLEVGGLSFATPEPGGYTFAHDPVTGAATLDGDEMVSAVNSAGQTVFRAVSGAAAGVTVTLTDPAITGAILSYGRSIADSLASYAESLLGASGAIAKAEVRLTADLTAAEGELADIDEEVVRLKERYNAEFGQMEMIITSLNRTGEYMTSLMEAWNRDT
jgi:flagellar hook-associated protein 2